MKTPREILLTRHQAVETELDRIRRDAVAVAADVNRRSPTIREFTFAATAFRALAISFRELIWPCRRTWGALAAVWMALLVFNSTQAEHRQTVVAKSTVSSGELRLALLEQQRLLSEIIGPPPMSPAEPPRRPTPQPHSERQMDLRLT
jgi:hypothetical protein